MAKRLHHLVSTKCIPGVLVKLHEVREKNHTITEDMLFQVSQHKVSSVCHSWMFLGL